VTNRCTLAQLREMTAEQVAILPVDQIAALLEDVADQKASLKHCDDLLNGALNYRYAEQAALMREAAGKNTGTVSVADGDFVIRADLPKKVEWDQAKLAEAVEAIRSWNEKPEDYVAIEVKVAESRYTAWPPAIQKLFEPARTVAAGRPTFKVERAKRRAA
jgi:hypothetical protein